MPTMAETTYEPGGVKTAVSGLGAAPYAGMDIMQRLIAKRLADYERQQTQAAQGVGRRGRPASPTTLGGTSMRDQQMRTAAQRAALARAQAEVGGAPQKLVTLPGMTTGYMTAPEMMSGAQRERFLPGAASVAPAGMAYGPSQMERWEMMRGGRPLASPRDLEFGG